jgi:hypothetical protein
MEDPLAVEVTIFNDHLAEWRKSHMGKFVLIKGTEVVGFYGSLEQAFTVGTGRFGLEPFLVRQIVPGDVVNVSFYGRRMLAS